MGAVKKLSSNQDRNLIDVFMSGKDSKTSEAYKHDLKCFVSFLEGTDLSDLSCLFFSLNQGTANFEVIKYKNDLLDKRFSPSTINRRLSTIRSLTKLARIVGRINWSIDIPNVKSATYRDTRGPGLSAFQKMLRKAGARRNMQGQRDATLLRLMFDLALRASEICSINVGDIDFQQNTISVKGKRDLQPRYLSISNDTRSLIESWLGVRGYSEGPLFPSLNRSSVNMPMTRQAVYGVVRRYGELVDIKTRPHAIRHLSITEACKSASESGIPLEEVLDFSRHSSVSTLMIYRDRIDDKQGKISSLLVKKLKKSE